MHNFINTFLKEQENKNLLRRLRVINKKKDVVLKINNKSYIDFSSNDYLSLSGHKVLIKTAKQYTAKYGTGGNASRLLSGTMEFHIELENKIAKLKQKESGLLFGNGFIANTTIIPALLNKRDVIFADRLVHASIIDGILLSGCKFFRFKHNDMNHLEHLLKNERKNYEKALIITESVFSMDGDIADLKSITALKNKYNALLYVDEAHATGIFGKTGAGIIEELSLTEETDIIMGTFGKALGSYGAYVVSDFALRNYLINKSRGFIYSTALPASVIGASIAAIDLLKKEPFRRKDLLSNSDYLRNSLKKFGIKTIGETQIIPVIIGDSTVAVKIAEQLIQKGYFVLPIRPPTVPYNSSRIRLSLNYKHSKKIIDKFISDFIKIYESTVKK